MLFLPASEHLGTPNAAKQGQPLHFSKEGKSAINLGNLGNFAKFGPGPFIYVRPLGGPENYLC